MKFSNLTLSAVLLCASQLAVTGVMAHGGATGIVKDRMDAMSGMAKAMKQMAVVVRGKQEFSPQPFIDGGTVISKHSAMILEMFPEGSIKGSSEALPLIWRQWDEFSAINDQVGVSAGLLTAMALDNADKRALTKQFVAVSKGCKACHKDYRKKK